MYRAVETSVKSSADTHTYIYETVDKPTLIMQKAEENSLLVTLIAGACTSI